MATPPKNHRPSPKQQVPHLDQNQQANSEKEKIMAQDFFGMRAMKVPLRLFSNLLLA
jgi:hypothetical protein